MKNKGSLVLVGGCFDILHYGHLTFLKKAKKKGDVLVVALESDQFIIKNKKKNPVHNQKQRAEVLESLKFIDRVIKLPYLTRDEDYFKMVKKINPDVIAVTAGDRQIENKRKQAAMIGAKVHVVTPLMNQFSSSLIAKNAPIPRG